MKNLNHITTVCATIGFLLLAGFVFAKASVQAEVGTALAGETAVSASFNYQGRLTRGGTPFTGNCNFIFSLWDAATNGIQVGTLPLANVSVNEGLFRVELDFGDQFQGAERWLSTSVQCPDDPGYTTLSPRQSITAVPYASSLRPGAVINTSEADVPAITVGAPNANSNALVATGTGDGYAVIFADDLSLAGGYGVWSQSGNGVAVYGNSLSGIGVWSQSGSGVAMYGDSLSGVAVRGISSGNNGIEGTTYAANRIGVKGAANVTGGVGVWGESSHTGVYGASTGGNGVWGESAGGTGVYGHSSRADGAGLFGEGYIGVQGITNGTANSQGVRGDNGGSNTVGYAGYFNGRVTVFGNLTVAGTLAKGGGSFMIDHPLDPANKYLYHSFVESPDMMNIYNGNVTTDSDGFATVTLPDWFEALNQDFRYQLTVIGQFAQAIVIDEIVDNQFRIQTDKPLVKVSWQVTGIRHDPFAEANRIPVEEAKVGDEVGHYLYPEVYGKNVEDSIWYATSPNAQFIIDNPDATGHEAFPGEGQ